MRALALAVTLCAPLVALPSAKAASSTLELRTHDACLRDESYRSDAVVLLVDRTTAWDDAARARWAGGVATILNSADVVGRLTVLEVRDTAVGTVSMGSGCLSDFRPMDAQGSSVSLSEDPWEWTKEQARRAWKRVTTPRLSPKEESERIWGERTARTAYAQALRGAMSADRPTSSNTEIAQSFASAVQSACGGKAVCRIYVFSDLLDSKAKRETRGADGEQEGSARARSLLLEMRPEITSTKLLISVWGFGRDDAQTGRPLDDTTRRYLRSYWRGYFEEFTKSAAAGSAFDIVDMLQQLLG
jgi:hypothetical protein